MLTIVCSLFEEQVVQVLSLEALEALVSEEDAWLVAFFKGK